MINTCAGTSNLGTVCACIYYPLCASNLNSSPYNLLSMLIISVVCEKTVDLTASTVRTVNLIHVSNAVTAMGWSQIMDPVVVSGQTVYIWPAVTWWTTLCCFCLFLLILCHICSKVHVSISKMKKRILCWTDWLQDLVKVHPHLLVDLIRAVVLDLCSICFHLLSHNIMTGFCARTFWLRPRYAGPRPRHHVKANT